MKTNTQPDVKTPAEVKAEFKARGQTITGWAREHGFPPRDTLLVLNGYYHGRHGRSHDIAVALGIKAKPDPVIE